MRKVFVVLVLVLFAQATAARGQEWARKMFKTTKHDFGSVAHGAKTEFRFKLTNLYVEDVHIAGVRSSCGCTTASKGPDLLKTYEDGYILATFNTKNHHGAKSATLTVTIDKPFPAEVQLQVSGFIRTDIEIDPSGVQFGTVEAGAAVDQMLTITARTGREWHVSAIRSSSQFVEAEAVEANRQLGDVRYEMQVRLLPGMPGGYFRERLIVVAGEAAMTEFPIEVEGRVQAALSATSLLFMGVVKPTTTTHKPLIVQGKQPFRITAIHCDDDCFTCECPQTAERLHKLQVTFTAPAAPGKRKAKLHITTDLQAEPTLDVPVAVNVVAPESDGAAE